MYILQIPYRISFCVMNYKTTNVCFQSYQGSKNFFSKKPFIQIHFFYLLAHMVLYNFWINNLVLKIVNTVCKTMNKCNFNAFTNHKKRQKFKNLPSSNELQNILLMSIVMRKVQSKKNING